MQNQTTQKPAQGLAGKVLNTAVNFLLILALVLAFVCTYSAYVSEVNNGVPSLMGYLPMSVQSDSMAPFFKEGDMVIARTVEDPTTLQEGDVITFWTIINGERALNTHRIVSVEDGGSFRYFVTKGDANPVEDSLTVHQNEVVGRYLFKLSGLGTVYDFMRTPKGFFMVVVLPVLAFFLYYLVTFFRVLFEYQAAKNRLKFEKELAEKAPAPGENPLAGLTPEQLKALLAQAQLDIKPETDTTQTGQ